jgi:hypothetical protein
MIKCHDHHLRPSPRVELGLDLSLLALSARHGDSSLADLMIDPSAEGPSMPR